MVTSEIDDIFASKGRPPPELTATSTSRLERKKKKKKAAVAADTPETNQLSTDESNPIDNAANKKRPAPETVLDPSTSVPGSKRAKVDRRVSDGVKSKKFTNGKESGGLEDELRFKDSRGSASRRKTDDGYTIYKEDELGISNEGGDTPLCPFDCECCF